MSKANQVTIRAVRTEQAGVAVYAFFLPGSKVLEIADISRLERTKEGLEGFQRDAIQKHISGMVDYLNSGPVLFPNAILLALSPRASFTRSRGPTPDGLIPSGDAGVLKLPNAKDGAKCAWIVDGQQRSTALARAADSTLPVPVIAFVSDDLQTHREQFILVNKARPLPKRMVDELLPEIDARRLPADMATRQIPSALVERLDADPESPFHGLIKRTSSSKDPGRIITDSALVRMLQKQINNPLGALASFRSLDGGSTDPTAMYAQVLSFWSAVKHAFPEAWGLPPEQSRLLHSAGIAALGALMDYLSPRLLQRGNAGKFYLGVLEAIAPYCAWNSGRWSDMDCNWNQIESTAKDIRLLSDQLIRLSQLHNLRHVTQ